MVKNEQHTTTSTKPLPNHVTKWQANLPHDAVSLRKPAARLHDVGLRRAEEADRALPISFERRAGRVPIRVAEGAGGDTLRHVKLGALVVRADQ